MPTRMAKIMAVATALILAATREEVRADLIIDQQFQPNAKFGGADNLGESIPNNSPLGQIFTPTLTSIGFATFVMDDVVGSAGRYDVQLRAGVNGTLLGTTGAVNLAADFGGLNGAGAKVEFDFASPISLTPGTMYSLVLVRLDGSSNFFAYGSYGVDYAGGSALISGSMAPGNDFSFSEGVIATPEPATIALAVTALPIGLSVWWRRRARTAG